MGYLKINDVEKKYQENRVSALYVFFSFAYVLIFPVILWYFNDADISLFVASYFFLLMEWLILYIFFYKELSIKIFFYKFIILYFPISLRIIIGVAIFYFLLSFFNTWLFNSEYDAFVDGDFLYYSVCTVTSVYFIYVFPKQKKKK